MTRPESAVERARRHLRQFGWGIASDVEDEREEPSQVVQDNRDDLLSLVHALEQRAEAAERELDEAVELLRAVNKSPTHGPDAKFYEVALHESFFDRLAALLARHDAKGGE